MTTDNTPARYSGASDYEAELGGSSKDIIKQNDLTFKAPSTQDK